MNTKTKSVRPPLFTAIVRNAEGLVRYFESRALVIEDFRVERLDVEDCKPFEEVYTPNRTSPLPWYVSRRWRLHLAPELFNEVQGLVTVGGRPFKLDQWLDSSDPCLSYRSPSAPYLSEEVYVDIERGRKRSESSLRNVYDAAVLTLERESNEIETSAFASALKRANEQISEVQSTLSTYVVSSLVNRYRKVDEYRVPSARWDQPDTTTLSQRAGVDEDIRLVNNLHDTIARMRASIVSRVKATMLAEFDTIIAPIEPFPANVSDLVRAKLVLDESTPVGLEMKGGSPFGPQ